MRARRIPRRVKNPEYRPIGYAPIEGLKIKNKAYDGVARQYLEMAGEIFDSCRDLDTTVSDTVLQGLAYIVHTAYDSQACSVGLDTGSFHDFIAKKTAEWFSSRGCAEWFCQGAAALFSTQRREVFHTIETKGKGFRKLTRVKVA
jgi:hypothetical protein